MLPGTTLLDYGISLLYNIIKTLNVRGMVAVL